MEKNAVYLGRRVEINSREIEYSLFVNVIIIRLRRINDDFDELI